jgi:CheY-like chemotaxis protein
MHKISSILVVDDDKIEHIIVQRAINNYDPTIELLTAYDGREAIDLLANIERAPDIILLDINMPGMDGHEFLAKYAESEQQVSTVVMLTTSDQEVDKKKCLAYPFVKQYIVKPLEEDNLALLADIL